MKTVRLVIEDKKSISKLMNDRIVCYQLQHRCCIFMLFLVHSPVGGAVSSLSSLISLDTLQLDSLKSQREDQDVLFEV